MEQITHIDEKGRKYEAWKGADNLLLIIGPHEGLVDMLGLPEPFATNLHNILHARKLYNYRSVSANPRMLQSALQEALLIDTQKLHEQYFRYEQEAGGSQ